MSELKPCPFCGNKVYVYVNESVYSPDDAKEREGVLYHPTYAVSCTGCRYNLPMRVPDYRNPYGEEARAAAKQKWNTRATDQATAELVEGLMSMVDQHCTTNDGKLDSCALSANAEAMYLLADHGLIEIEVDVGRRVIAKHKQQEQNDE